MDRDFTGICSAHGAGGLRPEPVRWDLEQQARAFAHAELISRRALLAEAWTALYVAALASCLVVQARIVRRAEGDVEMQAGTTAKSTV